MMTQQRTRTTCNPKLIAIFARLEKNLRANQIALDNGNSSDRGYNCEAKLSRSNSKQFTIRVFMRLHKKMLAKTIT